MKWWTDKYKELDAKVTDEIGLKIFQLGIWICLFIFIITNAVTCFVNQHLADRLFWVSFGIALICFSILLRNKGWVFHSFYLLSLYNLFDEIMGRGALLQWYEFPMALIVILSTYLNFKKEWKF